jgi:hypothetical protein
MVIAIDFDGTVVTHEYPKVGKDIGAIPILKKLVKAGHKLVLFTMRGDKELQDAVNWFKNNQIPLYGININPTQSAWTTSPKVFAQLYLDDAGIGCPLIYNPSICASPYVDWKKAEELLIKMRIINK